MLCKFDFWYRSFVSLQLIAELKQSLEVDDLTEVERESYSEVSD